MKVASRMLIALFAFLLLGALLLLISDGGLKAQTVAASPSAVTQGQVFQASAPVTPQLSRPVRDLPANGEEKFLNREINPMRNPGLFQDDLGLTGTDTHKQDPLAHLSQVNTSLTPGLLFSFEGLGTDGFAPPDTVGDVGPNHYVQMVNVSFRVFDKSGNPLTADTLFTALFAGSGLTACETENDGDPIVVYDEMADRWLLSQFAVTSGDRMCIAISTTPDPTSTFHLYQFNMPDFPDYFKFGVWPDAYYMGTNTGFPNQYYAYAFDRASMLAGAPATYQYSNGHANFLMPADLDGPNTPPAGTPGYFYTMFSDGYPNHPAGVDRIALYEFDVDWVTPANSTFVLAQEYPIAPYNYTVCGFFVGNCIPQLGTTQRLDSLSYWPMFRFAYRNLIGYEAMVGNFTVDLDGTDKAAIRWFEMQRQGGPWTLHQEGTYAPDGDHRFMGSIAMDGSGNIALGYSVSSATTIPSIRYATRLRSDPLGTLQAEATLFAGGGVQENIHRWGDYSAMSVDPADDCTFWYTNEYHDVNDNGFNWNTRVGVFRIPECTGSLFPDFTLNATPTSQAVCIPTNAVYTVNVGSILGFSDAVSLSASGTPPNYTPSFSPNPVTPPGSSTMTLLGGNPSAIGSYNVRVTGIAPTSTHAVTVTLDLYNAVPGAPALVSPADGANGVATTPTFTWAPSAQAVTYYIEIATDAGFSNIVDAASVSGTSYTPGAPLMPLTTYYWRVRADNACGTGTFSAPFSFTTKAQICQAPNIPIPDDPDVSDSFMVPNLGTITDLDVSLDVSHTWVGDLQFSLLHVDTGTQVMFIDRPGRTTTGFGCDGNNIDATINDEGTDGDVESTCLASVPTIQGDLVGGDPANNTLFTAFDGESSNGTWTLLIADNAGGDTGTLHEWCIDLTLIPNAAPVANSDTYTTTEDTLLSVVVPGVLGNDTDAESNPLTAVLDSTTVSGTLSLNSDGSFSYDPDADFCGTDSFTYHANDGGADSNVTTATINVTCVNDAPVAVTDTYTGTEEITLNISAPGVLGNDTDVEDDPLTAVLDSSTVSGTLSLNSDGSFSYDPDANFCGTDSFTYHANDGGDDSNTATVTLDIACENDVPTATDDSYAATEDTPLNVSAPGVLSNDDDVDGDPLTAVLDSTTISGTLTLNSDGSFSYDPDTNYCGPDSFIYHANDGTVDSNTATVTLTVACENDAPTANDDTYATLEDTPLTVAAPGVLGNDDDVEGDPLTAVLQTGPTNGMVTLNLDGSFTYTPTANYNGPDSFTYLASDGALSDTATVSIDVTSVNDPPSVNAGNDQTVDEGETVTFMGSYIDPGLLLLGRTLSGGELIHWDFGDGNTATGTLTPTHSYGDNDIFIVTLTVTDTEGLPASDTLTVTVNNVAPGVNAGPDQSVTVGAMVDFAASFTDPGWLDTHTIAWDFDDGGTASGVLTPTHTYTSTGVYTVTLTVTDDDGGVSTDTLVVTVTEPPTNTFWIYLAIIWRE